MNAGTEPAATSERCDLQEEFSRLVYADDQFVRKEFDALLAEMWEDREQ